MMSATKFKKLLNAVAKGPDAKALANTAKRGKTIAAEHVAARKATKPEPKMDLYFAVFNQLPEDAVKGMDAVRERFGSHGVEKVEAVLKNGAMAIFSKKPTPVTMLYAQTVADAVNARLGRT